MINMSAIETIKQKIAVIKQQREELITALRSDFVPMLKPLFDKYSGLVTSFGWTQYTPYFNDGEERTFGVRLDFDSCYINGEYVDDNESLSKGIYEKITEENHDAHVIWNSSGDGYKWYADKKVGEDGYFKNPNFNSRLDEAVREFSEVLSSIEDGFYKDLFGDHVLVTVNADGTIETEEYEHD